MKRLFALILVLLLTLAACAQDEPNPTDSNTPTDAAKPTQAATEAAQPTEPTALPTVAPKEEKPDDAFLGNLVEGTYSNSFFGFSCDLDESWTYASNEQLASLIGITADVINDEDLAEAMLESGVVYDMYATAQDGMVTASLAIENMGIVYGNLIDEDTYIKLSIDQLPTALEAMGLTNITAESSTVNFAGKERAAVVVHGMLNEVDFYETIVCCKVDRYMGLITVSSYYEDITDNVLSLFQEYKSK